MNIMLARRRADKGKVVVGIRKLRVVGVNFVNQKRDLFAILVALWRPSCGLSVFT